MSVFDSALWLEEQAASALRYEAEKADVSADADAATRAVRFARECDEREADAWRGAMERAADSGNTVSFEREYTPVAQTVHERVSEMLWYTDQGYFCGPEIGSEISKEDRAFAFSSHGEYVALCKDGTGDFIADPELEKRSLQAHELLEQTKRLAEKMGAAGFNAYRETPFELVRYFIHSRQVEPLPSFRRTCFLPYVAQALRAPMVAALEFWLSKHLFARFWTFSSGTRVKLPDVRARVQWLHAKLNDLNAQPFMLDAGVRMALRSTELGTLETDAASSGGLIERDADGTVCAHVHAHVVVEMTHGFIAPEKWSKLVAKVGDFWPAWWGEGGAIRNARECCKYLTKPGEMLKLSGAELVTLRDQLFRLKLVQPLGSLAQEIRERESASLRLVRKMTADGRVYHVVKNWNRHARRTRDEANQDAAEKLTPKTARGAVRIVSRGTPRCGRSGIAEPVVTVMFMRGSWKEDTVRAHPLVAPVIAATADEYQAGVAMRAASVIRVHTRTPTMDERPGRPRGKPKRARLGAAAGGF